MKVVRCSKAFVGLLRSPILNAKSLSRLKIKYSIFKVIIKGGLSFSNRMLNFVAKTCGLC
jgi:hypothetical protein